MSVEALYKSNPMELLEETATPLQQEPVEGAAQAGSRAALEESAWMGGEL